MDFLFLDESGTKGIKNMDKSYPVFSMVGILVNEYHYLKYYKDRIRDFKIKVFNDPNVILKSYHLIKRTGPFKILNDEKTEAAFYSELYKLLKDLELKIISTCIEKEKYARLHKNNPYDISFSYILEKVLLIRAIKDNVYITPIPEKRGKREDLRFSKIYKDIILTGTQNAPRSQYFEYYPADLSEWFYRENHAEYGQGLQIADIITYPIALNQWKPAEKNPIYDHIKDWIIDQKVFP